MTAIDTNPYEDAGVAVKTLVPKCAPLLLDRKIPTPSTANQHFQNYRAGRCCVAANDPDAGEVFGCSETTAEGWAKSRFDPSKLYLMVTTGSGPGHDHSPGVNVIAVPVAV